MNPQSELFEVSSMYWLIVLALSLCVACGYLWRIAFGKPDGSGRGQLVTAFAAAIVLCLTAVDGLNLTLQQLSPQFRVTGTVAVIAVTASLTWLHLSHWRLPRALFRRRPSGWLIVLSSMCLVGWSYHRFQVRLNPRSLKPVLLVATPKHKQEVLEFLAVTDRNRPIQVYRMADVGTAPLTENEAIPFSHLEVSIQRGPANPSSNCHGWVFLDAQFLISGDAVQHILDDNGYELVTEPKAGDVIIYRDDDRNIVHSGLVRGVLNDETVIIESKWGTEGLFLHDPAGTPYSQMFEYFRSPRPGNRVNVLPAEDVLLDE